MWFWRTLPFSPKSGQDSFAALDFTTCKKSRCCSMLCFVRATLQNPNTPNYIQYVYITWFSSKVVKDNSLGFPVQVEQNVVKEWLDFDLAGNTRLIRGSTAQHSTEEGCGFKSGLQCFYVDFSWPPFCLLSTCKLSIGLWMVVLSLCYSCDELNSQLPEL